MLLWRLHFIGRFETYDASIHISIQQKLSLAQDGNNDISTSVVNTVHPVCLVCTFIKLSVKTSCFAGSCVLNCFLASDTHRLCFFLYSHTVWHFQAVQCQDWTYKPSRSLVPAVALWVRRQSGEGGPVCRIPVCGSDSSTGGVLLQWLRWRLLWENPEGEQTERLGPQHPAGFVFICQICVDCLVLYGAPVTCMCGI